MRQAVLVVGSLCLALPLAAQSVAPAKVTASAQRIFGSAATLDTIATPRGPVLRAMRHDSLLGFATIREARGKDQPITFLVATDPAGRVLDVDILVYREAYGGEVKDRRFLKQYGGKDLKAPLLPYRDIQNVAGATLSVEAIGRGTKKALAVIDAVYLHPEGGK